MKNYWKLVKIGDIGEVVGGGTPSTKCSDYYGGDIPWITPKDLSNFRNRYISRGERMISKLGLENSSARILPPFSVLFTSRAPIGYIAIAKNELCTNQGFKSIIPDPKKCNALFLYYLLKYKKNDIELIANGSTFQEVSGTALKNFEVSIPPLAEQRKIAGILSALDDKIELNNKINRNLEAQAQAIFKSWFIDFEPFKNGKFIDSELGRIPEGWKVGSFSEVSDLLGGGTPKTTNNKFWNGTIPFFTPKDAIDIFVIETDRLITKEGLENCNTKLYPKGTIFITARGTVGKISLSGIEMAMNQSCYAIMPKHNIPTLFLYYQTVLLVKKLKNKASGAVFDAITTRDFDEAIIIPPLPIMNKFSETIERIFGAILNNIIQAKVLLKARDTLLPKLISGEIHVLDSNL